MTNHFKYSDMDFITNFQQCSISPKIFSHEAHLRLAYIYITDYNIEGAIKSIQDDLKRYVNFWGAKDKYNTTLTIASVKAVYRFMSKSKSTNFKDFILEFPRLKYHFKELLACHYTTDIFNSRKAKTTFLEPELLPFD